MYKKNKNCKEAILEGATLIHNGEDNSLHLLNETATVIWNNVEICNINEIVYKIKETYSDVSFEEVVNDVNETIIVMIDKGLLTKNCNN